MDGEARERIGSTGGMVKELLRLFIQPGITRDQNAVRVEAGEALAMLCLENKENCRRVLKEENIVERLVEALEDPVLSINSSRILRNLCAFGAPEESSQLRGVLAAFTPVSGFRIFLSLSSTDKDKVFFFVNITVKSMNKTIFYLLSYTIIIKNRNYKIIYIYRYICIWR